MSSFYRLSLFVLLLLCGQAQAGLYRWVDESGEVHYSDVVPPSASREGHSQLNDQGRVIKTWPPAPTDEEIAAKKRRETLMKLREAVSSRQKEQDDYLLANYTDMSQLEAVFSTKRKMLEQNSQNMQERRSKLSARLEALKVQTARLEDVAKRKELESYISDADKTLVAYDYALQENQTELDRLHQRYEKDKERLSILLSESPSSRHPDPSVTPAKQREQLARQ